MTKLTVIDVGHGSASVIEDKRGVVAVDTGPGSQLLDFLRERKIDSLESLILSHADSDHIGGAATLILSKEIGVARLLANSDSSKGSNSWRALIAAVAVARAEGRLKADIGVHVGTQIRPNRADAKIEVLYPPPELVMAGVGSQANRRTTSNSMSVALRVTLKGGATILLGGDVEYDCVDYFKQNNIYPTAHVVVFPHHGGRPGSMTNVSLFAFEMSRLVRPRFVIFSIHESKYDLPHPDVVSGIQKAKKTTKLLCTRLPQRLRTLVLRGSSAWRWHLARKAGKYTCREGHIVIEPSGAGVRIGCLPSRRT